MEWVWLKEKGRTNHFNGLVFLPYIFVIGVNYKGYKKGHLKCHNFFRLKLASKTLAQFLICLAAVVYDEKYTSVGYDENYTSVGYDD